MFLPHGAVLAGQYRVGKVLGRPGGFGITYLGWDIYLQQRVAIKEFLPPEMAARVPDAMNITVHSTEDRRSFDAGKDQFVREARIVAKLDHPNVVRVRAFFNANDTAYMVMDYYEGMTLDAYFSQVRQTLDLEVACRLSEMLLNGLAYVHERGVVHRDVKPHNIYLAAVGKPILLDFGAARKSAGLQHRSVSVVLTEGYAPLEQYQRNGSLGAWTDVFGVGATLYRMLVGRSPPIAIDRLQTDALETGNYEGIPELLKPIMRRALALRVEDRYQTAAEFSAALSAAVGSLPQLPSSIATEVRKLSMEAPAPAGSIGNEELLRDTTVRAPTIRIAPRAEAAGPAPTAIPAAAPAAASRTAPVASAPLFSLPPQPLVSTEPEPPKAPKAAAPVAVADKPHKASKARGLPAWLLPALAVLAMILALWYYGRSPEIPAARPADTAEASNSAAVSEIRRRFVLNGLPTLPSNAVPPMRDIPAGAYARSGAAALRMAAFRMAETEVTVGSFQLFISRSQYENPDWASGSCEGALVPAANWENPGYSQTADHPVVCVSQTDASAYTDWLAQETNRHFRLPTEAEWEYAAAAGAATEYWWGNQIDSEHAACADCGRSGESPTKPMLVASLGQNAFGLYGTAGNVREWTCSPKAPPLAQACALESSPAERIQRGGSWHDPSIALATTFRTSAPRNERNIWTGFRIVEDLSQ